MRPERGQGIGAAVGTAVVREKVTRKNRDGERTTTRTTEDAATRKATTKEATTRKRTKTRKPQDTTTTRKRQSTTTRRTDEARTSRTRVAHRHRGSLKRRVRRKTSRSRRERSEQRLLHERLNVVVPVTGFERTVGEKRDGLRTTPVIVRLCVEVPVLVEVLKSTLRKLDPRLRFETLKNKKNTPPTLRRNTLRRITSK